MGGGGLASLATLDLCLEIIVIMFGIYHASCLNSVFVNDFMQGA